MDVAFVRKYELDGCDIVAHIDEDMDDEDSETVAVTIATAVCSTTAATIVEELNYALRVYRQEIAP